MRCREVFQREILKSRHYILNPTPSVRSRAKAPRVPGGPCQAFRPTVLSPPNAVRCGTRSIPRLPDGLLPS